MDTHREAPPRRSHGAGAVNSPPHIPLEVLSLLAGWACGWACCLLPQYCMASLGQRGRTPPSQQHPPPASAMAAAAPPHPCTPERSRKQLQQVGAVGLRGRSGQDEPAMPLLSKFVTFLLTLDSYIFFFTIDCPGSRSLKLFLQTKGKY